MPDGVGRDGARRPARDAHREPRRRVGDEETARVALPRDHLAGEVAEVLVPAELGVVGPVREADAVAQVQVEVPQHGVEDAVGVEADLDLLGLRRVRGDGVKVEVEDADRRREARVW